LSDLKPGWFVSVTTKHEGGNEVAEIVAPSPGVITKG